MGSPFVVVDVDQFVDVVGLLGWAKIVHQEVGVHVVGSSHQSMIDLGSIPPGLLQMDPQNGLQTGQNLLLQPTA